MLSMQNAESRLASEGKIQLASADVYELELIKGIGDVLAYAIIDQKHQVLERAKELLPQHQYAALELVHGIGPATARKLGRQIDLGE